MAFGKGRPESRGWVWGGTEIHLGVGGASEGVLIRWWCIGEALGFVNHRYFRKDESMEMKTSQRPLFERNLGEPCVAVNVAVLAEIIAVLAALHIARTSFMSNRNPCFQALQLHRTQIARTKLQ